MKVEPTQEQLENIHVTKYLIESGQIHAVNAIDGKCIKELCVKCKLEHAEENLKYEKGKRTAKS